MNKVHCAFEGCSFMTWHPESLKVHEAQEHTLCTCGRYILTKGHNTHLKTSALHKKGGAYAGTNT